MSRRIAGLARSQMTGVRGSIRRNPRKRRDKFDLVAKSKSLFYNNDLKVAEGGGFEPPIRIYSV